MRSGGTRRRDGDVLGCSDRGAGAHLAIVARRTHQNGWRKISLGVLAVSCTDDRTGEFDSIWQRRANHWSDRIEFGIELGIGSGPMEDR